ncbi:hypothetical protein AWU68_0761 [Corynebacterium simulans]|nr:hypothetical protein AWU68_0761 [Corynebacterium simulans]
MTAFVDQDRGPGHHVRERPHPVDVNRARHRRRKRRNRAGVDAAPERPDEPAVLRNLEDHAIAGADAGFSQPSRSRHRLRVDPAIRDEDVPPILDEGDPLFRLIGLVPKHVADGLDRVHWYLFRLSAPCRCRADRARMA